MDSTIKIVQKTGDDFNIDVSLKGLTFRNIMVIKDVFEKYEENSDKMVEGLSKETLEQEHYEYRLKPVREILESLQKALVESNLIVK